MSDPTENLDIEVGEDYYIEVNGGTRRVRVESIDERITAVVQTAPPPHEIPLDDDGNEKETVQRLRTRLVVEYALYCGRGSYTFTTDHERTLADFYDVLVGPAEES
jgi:hypothetical protein